MSHGLFPSSSRNAKVHMTCATSPTGWGTRSLELTELGGLWDMPILFMDGLSGADDADIYHGILASAPGKVLHLGTDLLLTAGFRGGFEVKVKSERPQKRKFDEICQAARTSALSITTNSPSALPPSFSAPLDNDPARHWLPLTFAKPAIQPMTKGFARSGTDEDTELTDPLSDSDSDDECEDNQDNVVKHDGQKADWAPVPDQLWLNSFKRGYKDPQCAKRHYGALDKIGCKTKSKHVFPRKKPPSARKHQATYAKRFGTKSWNQFGKKHLNRAEKGYGWKAAMKGFRELGLRWWRRSLVRGFHRWRD